MPGVDVIVSSSAVDFIGVTGLFGEFSCFVLAAAVDLIPAGTAIDVVTIRTTLDEIALRESVDMIVARDVEWVSIAVKRESSG